MVNVVDVFFLCLLTLITIRTKLQCIMLDIPFYRRILCQQYSRHQYKHFHNGCVGPDYKVCLTNWKIPPLLILKWTAVWNWISALMRCRFSGKFIPKTAVLQYYLSTRTAYSGCDWYPLTQPYQVWLRYCKAHNHLFFIEFLHISITTHWSSQMDLKEYLCSMSASQHLICSNSNQLVCLYLYCNYKCLKLQCNLGCLTIIIYYSLSLYMDIQ